jgi:hypothetical protein
MLLQDPYETSSFPHCDKGANKSRTSSSKLFENINFYFATPLKSTGAPMDDCKVLFVCIRLEMSSNPSFTPIYAFISSLQNLIEKMGGDITTSPHTAGNSLLIIGDSLMTNKTYQGRFILILRPNCKSNIQLTRTNPSQKFLYRYYYS